MKTPVESRVLVINSGSSSVKFGLYQMGNTEELLLAGSLEQIGQSRGRFQIKDGNDKSLANEQTHLPEHEAAFNKLFGWLQKYEPDRSLDVVGHRIVYGGSEYKKPHLITNRLMDDLKKLTRFAPDHLPDEIKAIQAVKAAYPDLIQVACFDTAFHRHMPDLAKMIAIPRQYWQKGVVRYGFHGLSYEYILQELRKEIGEDAANGRIIIAHLGNGASMAAVRNGRSMDTTMGFTPASGLVMSTRSGDLDPGVLFYLMQEEGFNASDLNDLINHQSGLLGVSGISSDMKNLLEREESDMPAREAVDLFCYRASKHIGALTAVLGGIDILIFTGGIGENAPAIRQRICQNLAFLGVHLDEQRNSANAALISGEDYPVNVRVMRTNEDLMIAQHTYALIQEKNQKTVS